DQLPLDAAMQTPRGETLERKHAEWMEILGYLELEGRGLLHTGATDKDLLTQLEDARREPFTASVEGRLAGHVRHLLRSHLYPHRTRSLLAAENLIREAFDSQAQISDAEFASNVFDSTALSQSLAAVAQRAEEFVTASMEVASANAQIDLDLIDRSVFELRGKVGVARRRTATVLRTTGLLTSGASATLAVVALTNFWNPSGWAAAGILGGLGIASTVSNYLGRRTRRGAEERRAAARAGAIARARADINTFYDTCESEQLTQVVEESWRGASSPLADLLSEALRIRDGCATIVKEAVWLREEADRQPPTTSPAVVIYRATDRVVSRTAGWDQQGATALLLGEDWLIDPSQSEISPELSEIERQRFFEAARRQRAEFLAHLSDIIPATRAESIAHWLERAAGSEFLEPGTRKELHTARGLLSSQPTILVLGDYSSGKTTLIKRLLAEAGAETPATLRVEAGPATDDLERYQFGRLTLVDAPGFQSGDERLDALAVDASRDAALVIVVLHVNLLIGDPSRLAQLLLGDDTHIARTARTVFVIGRIDEVGADPQSAPADFLVRRRRKVEELHRILEASGLTSRPAQVFALSADPYGLVGDRSPVTSADYDSANKVWDGVNTLCEPLLVLDDERLGELSAEAALDRGRSTLASAHSLLADEIKGIERSQGDSDRLRRLTEASLAELRLLEQSIDRRTRRVVEDHAEEVLIEALGAGPDEVQAMAKRLESWWEDPRLEKAVESLAREVARDLTSWSQRHGSEFDRELARLGLATDGERSDSRDNDAGSGGGDGTQVAAQVVNQLANVVKAFGTRDAAYAFGKRVLDVKFKPWGAVKAGAKVAKIGAALGVVAVGFDIFAWVKDHKNETRREEARNAAVDHVRRTVDAVVASVLDDEDGPMDYVRQRAALITSHLKDFRAESEWRQRSVDDARQRLAAIAVLQQAGEALATGETERVTS
ncbi:MAG: LeoA/HP0731 family dynamin-like GTPase, partial [Acidimicrobiia bacterium]